MPETRIVQQEGGPGFFVANCRAPFLFMKTIFVLIAAFALVSSSSGTSEAARFHFVDATTDSGLSSFRHVSGNPREKRYILEVMSGGVVIFDYEIDGRTDI